MATSASAQPAPLGAGKTERPGITLDLTEAVRPYQDQRNLSVRIEQLPFHARFSKGRNNGDRTWSLAPHELADLVYFPPDSAESYHALTARVISIEGEDAKVLTTFEITVYGDKTSHPPGGKAASGDAPDLQRPATLPPADANAAAWLARAKRVWKAKDRKRAAEIAARSRAEMHQSLEGLGKEFEHLRLRAESAEQTAADLRGRLANAEKRMLEVEATGSEAHALARNEMEDELKRLREELADARENAQRAGDQERGFKQAEEALRSAHAREIADLEKHHAAELDRKASEARRQVEAEFEDRLATTRMAWERELEARLEDARRKSEAEADARISAMRRERMEESASALSEAAQRTERALEETRAQLSATFNSELERLRGELAKAEAALAERDSGFAEARAAWQKEIDERMAAASAKAERAAEERLARAREQWVNESGRALSDALARAERAEHALSEARSGTGEAADPDSEAGALREALAKAEAALAEREAEYARERAGWERRIEEGIAEARASAGKSAEARLQEAEEKWRLESRRTASEATARAERAERALKRAEEELEAARRQTGSAEASQAELDQLRHSLAEAEAALAERERQLQDSRTAWERELQGRLAEARAQAGEGSNEAFERARRQVQAEMESQLLTAVARAEQAERALAEARARPQNGTDANDEIERLRNDLARANAALVDRDAEMDHLRAAWNVEMEERLAKARAELGNGAQDGGAGAETAAALAEAIARAERAEQALEQARTQPDVAGDPGIEIDRLRHELAAANAALEERDAQLTEARHKPAGDAEERIAQVKAEAEKELAKAREEWEVETAAALRRAAEVWTAGENERMAAAREQWKASAQRGTVAKAAKKGQRSFQARRLVRLGLLGAGLVIGVILFPYAKTGVMTLFSGVETMFGPEIKHLKGEARTLIDEAISAAKPPAPPARPAAPAARAPTPAPAPPEPRFVNAESANVRAGPSTTTAVIGSLSRGTRITPLETRGEWIRLRFGEATGWIHRSLVRRGN